MRIYNTAFVAFFALMMQYYTDANNLPASERGSYVFDGYMPNGATYDPNQFSCFNVDTAHGIFFAHKGALCISAVHEAGLSYDQCQNRMIVAEQMWPGHTSCVPN